MTTVFFNDLGREHAVTFDYDADVVDLLKTVPKNFRSWRPETKQWRIASWYSPILARSLRQHEHHTVGIDVRDPPPHRNGHTQSWAQALFSTVGAERADQVHRALTRILHPDNPDTGDTTLQRDEVVPGLVELEVAVPRLRPAVCVVGVGRSTKNTNREGPP